MIEESKTRLKFLKTNFTFVKLPSLLMAIEANNIYSTHGAYLLVIFTVVPVAVRNKCSAL